MAASCALCLLAIELGGRLLMQPAERAYGALFGMALPPFELVDPARGIHQDREGPYRGLVVNGRTITLGDVAGYHRYDSVLGYTNRENTISVNRWWHSNNIGARELAPTQRKGAAGRTRWILTGESFAHGSGLPTHEGWAEIADAADDGPDIVNVAVDGFSMGQAYLRYQSMKDDVEHQGIVMMFVPGVDLWRDVNTFRDLGEGWKVQMVMPRFVVDGDSARLVPAPYSNPEALLEDNRAGLGARLRQHLRLYDRFYFPLEYEPVPILGRLITFKMTVAAYGRYRRGSVRRAQMKPGSEAMRISRSLFLGMQRDAAARSREFVLVVLPTATDLRSVRTDSDILRQWQDLVADACAGVHRCNDLLPALMAMPEADLDHGPDGAHFGPRTNRHIAKAMLAALGGPERAGWQHRTGADTVRRPSPASR